MYVNVHSSTYGGCTDTIYESRSVQVLVSLSSLYLRSHDRYIETSSIPPN